MAPSFFSSSSPSRSALAALAVSLPVVAPAVYVLALKAIVSRHIASSSSTTTTSASADKTTEGDTAAAETAATATVLPRAPHSIPPDVIADRAPYVLSSERITSLPVPVRSLTLDGWLDGHNNSHNNAAPEAADATAARRLLTAYLCATMEAFSWTPPALAIRASTSDPAVRHTFDADYLRGLDFAEGDLVNGVYQATYRGASSAAARDGITTTRVELSLVPLPDSPSGLMTVQGVIVAEVAVSATSAVFVNETWLWRHRDAQKPTLLEGAVGRWLHLLLGSWLVFKGISAITAGKKEEAKTKKNA